VGGEEIGERGRGGEGGRGRGEREIGGVRLEYGFRNDQVK
jgi:hypothetical protein